MAVACALGAEEFGFATAPLVALGCLMLRACNLDTCAAGIAPRPCSAPGFSGKAEFVMAFMTYLAQEVREILAPGWACTPWRSWWAAGTCSGWWRRPGGPDVCPLLAPAQARRKAPPASVRRTDTPFRLEDTLDHRLLLPALGGKALGVVDLTCRDRAFGTMLGSEVTRRFGDSLPEDTYRVACRGRRGAVLRGLPAGRGHPGTQGMPTTTLGKACPGQTHRLSSADSAPNPRGTR